MGIDHAGEHLDPIAVAEAKAKRKARKLSVSNGVSIENPKSGLIHMNIPGETVISSKHMAIEGYAAQSEMVIDSLDRLNTSWENRKESWL